MRLTHGSDAVSGESPRTASNPPDGGNADDGPFCGQCGEPSSPDSVHCSRCAALLPDSDSSIRDWAAVESENAGETVGRRWWTLLGIVAVLVAVGVGWTIVRVTEPEPQELAATEAAQAALSAFDRLENAQDVDGLRNLAPVGVAGVAAITRSLAQLDSDDGTRPRLDGYRTLFRGIAALGHLSERHLAEWSPAKQRIQTGLGEVVRHDPLAGLLQSRGSMAVDSVQDLVDEEERRVRAATEERRLETEAKR